MYNNEYLYSDNNYNYMPENDERFFLGPLIVGGLAGTALGYGIANNNQLNKTCCNNMYPFYPIPYFPNPYYSNNFNTNPYNNVDIFNNYY